MEKATDNKVKLTFLVVDDNDTISAVMPRFLTRNFQGCEVITAESFDQGREALKQHPAI